MDGETGLLVPPRDPQALRAALERLLADRGLRRRLGAAGRERARERFSWDAVTDATIAAYRPENERVKRALITGIGGQDGSYLSELLLERGYEVVGLVRPGAAPYDNLAALAGQIELCEADLLNQTSLAQALRAAAPTEIYNLAAPSFVPASWEHRCKRRSSPPSAQQHCSKPCARRFVDSLLPGVVERDLR